MNDVLIEGTTLHRAADPRSNDGTCQPVTDDMIRRYIDLFPMRRSEWHEQKRYVPHRKNQWYSAGDRRLTDGIIRDHLDPSKRYWIACRCPVEGNLPVTKFLALDFDVKESWDIAWNRLNSVIAFFERTPFVCSSPGGGFHAFWFFDQQVNLASLVKLGSPQSRGLLPDLLGSALGERIGPGVCEVYPQNGQVFRWPLGTDQHRVDLETGNIIASADLNELLLAVERHRDTMEPLTLSHLRSLKPSPSAWTITPKARLPVSVTTAEIADANRFAGSIHAITVASGVSLFRDGLTARGTRNWAMYHVALVMVHAPDALAPFGFDMTADPGEQLFAWLDAKHNGLSTDYTGSEDTDRDWWRRKCQDTIRDARNARPLDHKFPEGYLRLTDAEWDTVFSIGDRIEVKPSRRYRLEIVAASVLRKAKWSVAQRGFGPSIDGTFPAEIHSVWWAQIPFCKHRRYQAGYRDELMSAELFRPGLKGNRRERRANIYEGFPLVFEGRRPELPYTPGELAWMAGQMKEESAVLEYCLVVTQRFPDLKQREDRYGEGGERYISDRMQTMRNLSSGSLQAMAISEESSLVDGQGAHLSAVRDTPKSEHHAPPVHCLTIDSVSSPLELTPGT